MEWEWRTEQSGVLIREVPLYAALLKIELRITDHYNSVNDPLSMLVLYNSTVCLYGTYLSLSEAMSCSVSAVFSAELEDISFSAARFSDATVASWD